MIREMTDMSDQKCRRSNFEEEKNATLASTPPYELPSTATNNNCWKKRSKLETVLIVVVVMLFFIIVFLAIILLVLSSENDSYGPYKVKELFCTSKSCINAASSILKSIDESVNPCEDFYQFSCGNWIKSNPIPAGYSMLDPVLMAIESNLYVLKRFLDTPASQSDSIAMNKTKDFYTSCMDPSGIIENLGDKPLFDLIKDFGGWSISDIDGVSWDGENWNLQEMTEKMHKHGLGFLFVFYVYYDEKEPTKNILKVDQVFTTLEKDNYANKTMENNTILEAYYQFMVEVGEMLGGETNLTRELMLEVYEFERALNEITTPKEERRDHAKNYNKMKILELQRLAPFIDWKRFFNQQLAVVNITVDDSEPIIVFAVEFLTKLDQLLKTTLKEEHGKRTIHNYMIWKVVSHYCGYLSKKFTNAKNKFRKIRMGTVGEMERWKTCVRETDNVLGFALGAMYVREKFRGESKTTAEIMIRNIKEAFIRNLPNLAWMDEETRSAAVDKANAVVEKIGYPNYILNSTAVDLIYDELTINKDEYFMNKLKSVHFTIKVLLGKLRKAPDQHSWSMSPPTVNAYYARLQNEIVFPAGILQPPFYDKDFPKSLNYGGIGSVMGHELVHGFDESGRKYDKDGVLRVWWNENSIQAFENRTKCLIDQYSGYSVNGQHLKGKLTLGENIADNGGLKSAYYAYDNLVKKSLGPEPLLPGVHFNHRQLFFIAYAQGYCTASTPGDISDTIMSDPHSLSKFRIIGPITNLPEFSDQFNCPLGSPMNPVHKCEVW